MNFLADENFPVPSIHRLRQAGHDVSAIITDAPGSADRDILVQAAHQQRIILTFDRDFGELIFHFPTEVNTGVVYFRFEPAAPEEPAEVLLRLLDTTEIVLHKHFTVVERRQIRQRALPEST